MAKGKWEREGRTVQPPSEAREEDAQGKAVAAITRAHKLCESVAASSADMRVASAYEAAALTLADVVNDLSADEVLEDDD